MTGELHTVAGAAVFDLLVQFSGAARSADECLGGDGKNLYGLFDILEGLRSQRAEAWRKFAVDEIVDLPLYRDSTSLGRALETGGDVYTVAVDIAASHNYVADMHADPKLQPALRRHRRIAQRHLALDLCRTLDGFDSAREFRQGAVAHEFHHATAVPGDGWADQFGMMPLEC